jgi:hypothetical protein
MWKPPTAVHPSTDSSARRADIPRSYPPSELPCLLIGTSLSAVSTSVMTKAMIVFSKREEQNNHSTLCEDRPAQLEAT